ncbi:MAG: hypothetical protein AB8B91_23100 [Rubripirellula sp.]
MTFGLRTQAMQSDQSDENDLLRVVADLFASPQVVLATCQHEVTVHLRSLSVDTK